MDERTLRRMYNDFYFVENRLHSYTCAEAIKELRQLESGVDLTDLTDKYTAASVINRINDVIASIVDIKPECPSSVRSHSIKRQKIAREIAALIDLLEVGQGNELPGPSNDSTSASK